MLHELPLTLLGQYTCQKHLRGGRIYLGSWFEDAVHLAGEAWQQEGEAAGVAPSGKQRARVAFSFLSSLEAPGCCV